MLSYYIYIELTRSTVKVLSGGSKGGFPSMTPYGFLENFGKIVGWRPLLEGWRLLLQGILDPPLVTSGQLRFSQLNSKESI